MPRKQRGRPAGNMLAMQTMQRLRPEGQKRSNRCPRHEQGKGLIMRVIILSILAAYLALWVLCALIYAAACLRHELFMHQPRKQQNRQV
jgi:hypothetical protein